MEAGVYPSFATDWVYDLRWYPLKLWDYLMPLSYTNFSCAMPFLYACVFCVTGRIKYNLYIYKSINVYEHPNIHNIYMKYYY